MTQPSTSANSPNVQTGLGQDKFAENGVVRSAKLPNSEQPAIIHPNFDPAQTPLDPARPLTDIPEPARRVNGQLRRLYGKSAHLHLPDADKLSKWQLMASEPFAEHLALLSAAKLIELPDSFYHNYSTQDLLSSLETMTLLDIADIQRVINQYPELTRYGFLSADSQTSSAFAHANAYDNNVNAKESLSLREVSKRYNYDELFNSLYAEDWQVVLQPEQFETGMGSLATDIMACSIAVHALKQGVTRKSINSSYCAAQICQYVRSYLLSQIVLMPAHRYQYRQIPIFTGHIIVAAHHLGWDIQLSADRSCYFNVSSRCGLLTRYANMHEYYINGWSSTTVLA